MKNFIVLTFFLVLTVSSTSLSQTDWEAGAFIGVSSSQGDVVPTHFYTFQENNMAYGLYLKKYLNANWGLRLAYYKGTIDGDDQDFDVRTERLANFRSPISELSLRIDLDAKSEDGEIRSGFVPFLFAGAGLTFFNPDTDYGLYQTTDFASAWVAADEKELDSQMSFAVPAGIGLKYHLNSGWNLALELGYRIAFTDYLDGISETGDPTNNDSYFFGGLTFGKRMNFVNDTDGDGIANKKDQCPEVFGIASLDGCPDSDMDGVADKDDNCPELAGLLDFQGCPDTDGDGIIDAQDNCPEVAGDIKHKGCPDTDGDGIVDSEDDCPRQAGIRRFNGCADSDNDGIVDNDDQCPQEAGVKENDGCPDRDSDGDSIVDRLDECPDVAGLSKFNGCPDTDGDGIKDQEDKCPNSAGPASNNGCPEIKQEDQETLDLAVKNVNFETGKAILTRASYGTLDQIADILMKYPDYDLKISGYTDSSGNDDANQQLSEQRAAACLDYLVSKGIEQIRMASQGYGEANPVATNDTVAGRSLNRRVEFELYLK